jgi:hypothetical protein
LRQGYFKGAIGGANYLNYDQSVWPFRGNNSILHIKLTIDSNGDSVRIFSTDHSGGSNFEFRTTLTGDNLTLDLPTGSGIHSSPVIDISDFIGSGRRFTITWQWSYSSPNTTVKSYLNGIIQGSSNSSAFKAPDPDLLWSIGHYGAQGFDGQIHEIQCLNRVLTDANITKLYDGRLLGETFPARPSSWLGRAKFLNDI